MGTPIKLRDKFIGYIVVEHNLYKFLSTEIMIFLDQLQIKLLLQ